LRRRRALLLVRDRLAGGDAGRGVSAPSLASGFRATAFAGDFDALPLRAHVLYGATSPFPTEADFHLAASHVAHDDDAAAHWNIECIRERRSRPGAVLDPSTLNAIALRVAARLYAMRDSEDFS
jgi:hypothetical protein